jgi:hypothetical protein
MILLRFLLRLGGGEKKIITQKQYVNLESLRRWRMSGDMVGIERLDVLNALKQHGTR